MSTAKRMLRVVVVGLFALSFCKLNCVRQLYTLGQGLRAPPGPVPAELRVNFGIWGTIGYFFFKPGREYTNKDIELFKNCTLEVEW